MGILDLLLPLINLLGQDMADTLWPSLTQVHQRLHDIVAEAAWFTNGMRATRSVFWIQFPLPGELNDISHEHATDDIWKRSKRRAEAHDVKAEKQWEATRDEKLASENPGQVITQAHRAAYEAANRRPYIRRTAKVQVAMWPFIKRFTPMRERDAGDGAYNAGETITQIMKAQCVYYNGDDSDEADLDERLTLSEQIKNRRWAKWFTMRAFLLYALIFLLFLFITSPEVQTELGNHFRGVGSSSEDQGSLKESRTTTTVPGPVGGKTATITGRKTTTVTGRETVTVTETETVILESDGRADDSNNNNDNNDDDDDNVDVDNGGNVSTGEATAEKTASLKDRAAEELSSAKDRIASEMSSKTEKIKSSLSSERDRLSSIESSVRESVKSSIADENSRSDARQTSADESSSSRAHESSIAKSRAAEESSKSKAARSSSSAANAASRSSAEEIRKSKSAARSSSSSANAAKSRSEKESRSSSRSSSSAEITAQRSSASLSKESRRSSESRAAAESRAQAEAESSAAAERAALSEHSILAEVAASRLALEEEEKQRIRSVLAEKEAEDRRMSSSFYAEEEGNGRGSSSTSAQQEKESETTTSLPSEEEESGSSASKKRGQGPEITTQGDGIDTTTERKTVTVEPGVVVVTATRPLPQAETKGSVGTVEDKGRQRPRAPGPKEEKCGLIRMRTGALVVGPRGGDCRWRIQC